MKRVIFILLVVIGLANRGAASAADPTKLWSMYDTILKTCKYVDLTHSFNPTIAVWPGFSHAVFKPGQAGADIPDYVEKGQEYTYAKHGFVSTAYELPTDQYGTQLDPPAHWDEYGATISDLPATYAVRPLVVIDTHAKVKKDPGYHCTIEDIKAWEKKHSRIPAGAVAMIRSDWHKKWPEVARFNQKSFPGIKLDVLKFLHLERQILFHGHEPLDTDTTPAMEGEAWLMHHHFCQAEGVAHMNQMPEAGALIAIGFAKHKGGTGGYAHYVAICPPGWKNGQTIAEAPGAPLPKQPNPLRREATASCGRLNVELSGI